LNFPAGQDREERSELLRRLDEARQLAESGQTDQAVYRYRVLLRQQSMASFPDIRTQAMLSLATLLLQEARPSSPTSILLDEAIKLFTGARAGRSIADQTLETAIADTNLALAYCRRFERSDNRTDLLVAHLTLDDAEAVMLRAGATETLDWLHSVRALLLDLASRHRRAAR